MARRWRLIQVAALKRIRWKLSKAALPMNAEQALAAAVIGTNDALLPGAAEDEHEKRST